MRSIWMITFKNILKRKTYAIAIFLLTAVAAVCMATGLSTIFRSRQIYDAAYTRANSPDNFYLYYKENYSPAYLDFFRKRAEVRSENAQTCLGGECGTINGVDLSTCIFAENDPKQYNFAFLPGAEKLTDHSLYLPIVYQQEYNAKVGGTFFLKTGSGNLRYRIAGFFEDPVYGSAMMGMKRVLLTTGGYRQLREKTLGRTTEEMVVLQVNLKPAYEGANFENTMEAINRAFGSDTLATYQTDRGMFHTAVLIIPSLIAVVMLSFAVLLLLVVILVLRHAILSSIEADYVSFGILKAIGFTGPDVLISVLLQYIILVLFGAAAGVIAAVFVTPAAAGVLMGSTGIIGRVGLTVSAAVGVPAALLLLCALVAGLTARHTAVISPMRAISYGKAPVHFSSRLNPSLSRMSALPQWLSLPMKQMASRLTQYATLIIVAALFTFMLSTMKMMTSSFASEGRMTRILGVPVYDIDIESMNPTLCPSSKLEDVVRDINRTYGVKDKEWRLYKSVRIDGDAVTCTANSTFAQMEGALLKGSMPQAQNEVAVTPFISSLLHKSVGDTVVIQKGNIKKNYLISGVVQDIDEMGKVIELNEAGYRGVAPNFKPMSRSVTLKNGGDVKSIISALKKKYPPDTGITFANNKTQVDQIFSSVNAAMKLASAAVMALTLLLISCITLLLCSIAIYRENIDTGIFKAIGFKTRQLRIQFTLRFLMVAVLGGAVGIVLSLLFSQMIINALLSNIGIASLPWEWNFATIGFPLLFVVCVTGLTAFVCSARMRHITPARLISE